MIAKWFPVVEEGERKKFVLLYTSTVDRQFCYFETIANLKQNCGKKHRRMNVQKSKDNYSLRKSARTAQVLTLTELQQVKKVQSC